MAQVKFALEPLLKVRRLAEQRQQRAVAEVERERIHLEDQLRLQQMIISQARDDMRTELVGSLDTQALRHRAGSTLGAMREAQRLVLAMAGVHRKLDAAQAELRQAMADRRAIELLRDKRHAQWKQVVVRREIAESDDLTSARYRQMSNQMSNVP